MYEDATTVKHVTTDPPRRPRLSRERVLDAAVAIADERGLAALTIRSLADRLGSRPMALYHHVRSKEEILDGIVDVVFSEIDLPRIGGDWPTMSWNRGLSSSCRRRVCTSVTS